MAEQLHVRFEYFFLLSLKVEPHTKLGAATTATLER